MNKRYKGCVIETSTDGLYAQVRQEGHFIRVFCGPTSYDDAKRWIDEQVEEATR